MRNIIDILIEKWLFNRVKHNYYNSFRDISHMSNNDSHFYLINFGILSLKFFKLKHITDLINQFKNSIKFKNKIGIITLNNYSKKYIRYVSEIAEIFDIPIIVLFKKELYMIKENTIKIINNSDYFYFKTTKFYFLNNSSDILYQLMDIRLENPHFLIVNNAYCHLQKYELNSISSALSTYLIAFDKNKLSIYKPENNNSIEYKLKEHFILKFNIITLSNLKNGITKFDEKKIELLLKYI
ncbi:hypothetical protein SAMN02745164_00444 [Marinitoga hydrogenitolerans DSM 16785]|uniref:Uncharacterized protein n=1 Tax=Marinitoga hydrogenitolerans (strain DSM 16785 / JCM 12826 / AT1271) TaxID=1122195 RepID=A0A1M4TI09_MARH1|nr:hypothetical protein [Marinitoga hydrogenitolerans]SHE44058.1 hypothetical protein SAMN02745164_00444 [Marinitoga hydrogenitolerans DSM 16785]